MEDPNARTVRLGIPLGGQVLMTKGLATALGLASVTGWPSYPTGARRRVAGPRRSKSKPGKIAFIEMNDGGKYVIRYTGTFRRLYQYLRETATNFEDAVTSLVSERAGSSASKFDSSPPTP